MPGPLQRAGRGRPAAEDMITEKLSFPGALGHDLSARLDRSEDPIRAFALFAHCFTCSKDLKAATRISRSLVQRGIAVLRFDFTGLGQSEGEFAETNFTSNLGDLEAAVEYLRLAYQAPQLLIGHSLGGAAVLTMASKVPECRGVVTLGAPSDTRHLRDTLLSAAPELGDDREEVEVTLAGRPFLIQRQFLDDLEDQKVLKATQSLGRPLLVMHSPVDAVVDIDHARRIYEAAKHPRSFISLDDADHLLIDKPADAEYAAEVIAAWAGRYIQPDESSGADRVEKAVALTLAEGEVSVSGQGGLRQSIRAGGHVLVADEPERLGGGDEGPNPYDLLLAALGACTNMTLRMYAWRKKWPLAGVDSVLRHRKIHAQDCEECESEDGRIDVIERELTLSGDLSEQQAERLMEIADRCPVHRTLTSETVIRSRRT